MKKTVKRGMVLLLTVGVILGAAYLITALIQGGSVPANVSSVSLPPVSVPQPVVSSQAPADPTGPPSPPAVDNTSWNFVGPVQQDAGDMQLIAPDYRMIALPENGRVDMRYFDTVTFVGDSLTQGMKLWGVPNAHYCAYKSIGPKGIYDGSIWTNVNDNQEVPLEALAESQPDNVYVLLGPNAMVAYRDNDIFVTYFSEMLDAMKAALPEGVHIYLQSITPVRPGNQPGLQMERINTLNDMLAKLAWEKEVYFVDLTEALAGEDGYLREEYGAAKDGYHLTSTGVKAWVEYLITHTAYSPKNPYLEGSHYYSQLPKPE